MAQDGAQSLSLLRDNARKDNVMAPLPQNNTDRYYFDYTTGVSATSQEHTVVVRVTDSYAGPTEGTIEEGVQSAFLSVLNLIGPSQFRTGWKVTRVRLALKGEDY